MVGILTRISLGILVVFHLLTTIGQLFKVKPIISKLCDQVSPPYDPATILVGGGEGIPGKGETPIENLLEGVFGCW